MSTLTTCGHTGCPFYEFMEICLSWKDFKVSLLPGFKDHLDGNKLNISLSGLLFCLLGEQINRQLQNYVN